MKDREPVSTETTTMPNDQALDELSRRLTECAKLIAEQDERIAELKREVIRLWAAIARLGNGVQNET